MITYIATFYSHYGAIQFRRNCQAMNLSAEVMPVPRDLSSSCGTCVRFHTEADFPEKTEEVEQIVRVEPQGYVGIYHADEEYKYHSVHLLNNCVSHSRYFPMMRVRRAILFQSIAILVNNAFKTVQQSAKDKEDCESDCTGIKASA